MQTVFALIAVFTMEGLSVSNTIDTFATEQQCEQRIEQLERLNTDLTLYCTDSE